MITASQLEHAPLVTVEAIETLGVLLTDVDVACHNLPQLGHIKGLLGLSYLRRTSLTLRMKEGFVELRS